MVGVCDGGSGYGLEKEGMGWMRYERGWIVRRRDCWGWAMGDWRMAAVVVVLVMMAVVRSKL